MSCGISTCCTSNSKGASAEEAGKSVCSISKPRAPEALEGLWELEAQLWGRTSFICEAPLSLCGHSANVSVTSISQNVQSTAILLFSSILLMCSGFLYAKYVEAINTLTCSRCAAREICPFGQLFPFRASPVRQTPAGAWIAVRD